MTTLTHALTDTSRSDKTACRLYAFDIIGRPIPEVVLDPSCPSCPVCNGFVRIMSWIKHEQKRLIRRGHKGDEALRLAIRQLTDAEHAAWLCEPVEEYRANRAFLRKLRAEKAAREAV